ncbi:MAG: hypothetical protein ACK4GN_15655 [Runella sp.]
MLPITVFYFKLILTVFSSALVWWGAQADTFWQKIQRKGQSDLIVLLGLLLLRFVPFLLVYLILNQTPRGDVPFFWGKATVAYRGMWVYRDFVSFHAPLFGYIIMLPLWLWYSSKAIVLLMVLIEACIVWGTYRTYHRIYSHALRNVILYLLLSAPLVMVLLGGQEDVWLWGVAVLMLYYFKRTKDDGFGLGMRFSVGLLAIKATFGFWLFPLWLLLKKRWSFMMALVLVGAVSVSVLYYFIGLDFLMPLQMTTNLLTPNLFTIARPLITAILGHAPVLPPFSWVGLVFTLSSAMWVAYRAQRLSLTRSLPLAFLATYIAMTFFQLSSPGYYAFTYLLPLVMELVNWRSRREVAILLIFNLLLVVQPFLFTYLNSPTYDDPTVLLQPLYLLEYTLQVLNVACYGGYFLKILQKTY